MYIKLNKNFKNEDNTFLHYCFGQFSNLPKIREALVPPKPKEFVIT